MTAEQIAKKRDRLEEKVVDAYEALKGAELTLELFNKHHEPTLKGEQ